MRIVFFGTPAFAVPSFEACLALGEVAAAVTQPDRPAGRGHRPQPPPVKEAASARGVPVLQPAKLRDGEFAARLAGLRPDVAVVAAYGRILPPDVLAVPARGCVNVHGSLLPRFRGAAPIQRAIAAGDARTGVTLMQMDAGLDTGPTFAVAELDIRADDTSATLSERLSRLGADLLRDALPAYLDGSRTPSPQLADGVVLAPPVAKEEGRLDFARTAAELERQVRAFEPWPRSSFEAEGGLVQVRRAAVGAPTTAAPGTVVAVDAHGIGIACGGGTTLRVVELQVAGGRAILAAAFARGRSVPLGTGWVKV